FGKESGPGSGMAWLTGSRQIRNIFSSAVNDDQPFSSRSTAQSAVMVDDSRMEELREELNRNFALGEGLETRLRALEHEITQSKQLPETIDARVRSAEAETEEKFARIRRQINQSRK